MKILLCAFNIDIEDLEDTLHAWKAKSMLKKNVTCKSSTFLNVSVYNDFGVKGPLYRVTCHLTR